jgi:hypothetical protein
LIEKQVSFPASPMKYVEGISIPMYEGLEEASWRQMSPIQRVGYISIMDTLDRYVCSEFEIEPSGEWNSMSFDERQTFRDDFFRLIVNN